jgi:hypothetical protein
MKISLALALLFISQLAFSQDSYFNQNQPFVDETPNPVFNQQEKYIEIVYELDLKTAPDPSNPTDWVKLNNNIHIVSLKTDIEIGNKTYTVNIPGVSIMTGKFTFRIHGYNFNQTEQLSRTNWQYINFSLNFEANNIIKSTSEQKFRNEVATATKGSILVLNSVKYNTTLNKFELKINATANPLDLTDVQILSSKQGDRISTFDRQEPAEVKNNQGNSEYQSIIRLLGREGYNASKIIIENEYNVYIKAKAKSAGNPNFAEYEGIVPVTMTEELRITDPVLNSIIKVSGSKSKVIRLTISQISGMVSMKFNKSPFATGADLIIPGKPVGQAPTNIFEFEIPSDSKDFKYGDYNISFSGNSDSGNPIQTNQFTFSKEIIPILTFEHNQVADSCHIRVKFSDKSSDEIILVFAKSGSTKKIKAEAGVPNSFTTTLKTSDSFILENIVDNKSLNIYFMAFNHEYTQQQVIPVKVISTKTANKELEALNVKKSERKAAIKKYLEDNGFQGNMEEMTTSIFDELSKKPEKRDWPATWNSVGKLLKPLSGLLLLLI